MAGSIIIIVSFFILFYLLAVVLKNNSIVDTAWGLGFLLVTVYNYVTIKNPDYSDIIALILIAIWALRLSFYIFKRNYMKPEDFRYKKWRNEWGRSFYIRSFFQIFMLQAFLQFIIVLPVILSYANKKPPNMIVFFAGAAVFLIGFAFEAAADKQLKDFKKDPGNKGRIIKSGLWKYSRHPNYFGEFVIWTGVFILSLGRGVGIIGVVSPLMMYLLLNYVSGVPLLEKKYAGNPEFEEYKKETSVFFPCFKVRGRSVDIKNK